MTLIDWTYLTVYTLLVVPMAAYMIAKLVVVGVRRGRELYQRERVSRNGEQGKEA